MEKKGGQSSFGRSLSGWRGNLLLLIVSSSIMLIGAEAYFRNTSPYIVRTTTTGIQNDTVVAGDYGYFIDTFRGRRLIPNTQVIRVDPDTQSRVPIHINAQGFRDHEMPTDKAVDEIRILVLGDSITLGAHVVWEHTFVEQVEAALTEKYRPRKIECINAGVEGIGTKDEVDILVEQGLQVSPDIVVVGFYLNDGNLPDRLAAGLANPGFIRRRSVLAQTIYRAYKERQWRAGNLEEANMYDWTIRKPPEDWRTNRASFLRYAGSAEKDWGAAWKPGTWIGIEEQMKRLQSIAERHSIKVVFVAFPIALQVYADYVEDLPQQKLGELCGKYHFQYLDMLPIFRKRPLDPEIFTDGIHLTYKGHDIVGKALANYLSRTVMPGAAREVRSNR